MDLYYIEGKFMTDRKTAYSYIAKQLNFPDYFGNNLDALADCLSEMPKGCAIILSDTQAIIDNLSYYGEAIIDVFKEIENRYYLVIRD
ncbi:MAG: barstar family protein [Erysipelotrichaceae bacterium]|nr:barstar family protein [Erysipelotrichaceae bacterium]